MITFQIAQTSAKQATKATGHLCPTETMKKLATQSPIKNLFLLAHPPHLFVLWNWVAVTGTKTLEVRPIRSPRPMSIDTIEALAHG